MIRFTVALEQDERDALRILAERERRDPRAQAAFLIRCELERHGLLPENTGQPLQLGQLQAVADGRR
jgi:hypothetical protein